MTSVGLSLFNYASDICGSHVGNNEDVHPFETCRRLVSWKYTDVSEEHTASVFKTIEPENADAILVDAVSTFATLHGIPSRKIIKFLKSYIHFFLNI